MENITFKQALPYITAAALLFTIWNIWEQHKYRKMEQQHMLSQQNCTCQK